MNSNYSKHKSLFNTINYHLKGDFYQSPAAAVTFDLQSSVWVETD